MKAGAAFRGQPLLLLGGLLAGWFALRASTWEPLLTLPAPPPLVDAVPLLVQVPAPVQVASNAIAAPIAVRLAVARAVAPAVSVSPQPPIAPIAALSPSVAPGAARRSMAPAAPRYAVGHNLLLAAGLAQTELPAMLLAYLRAPTPGAGVPAASPPLLAVREPGVARWSADAWLLLRGETTAPVPAGLPSYGRSQTGGVLRYLLAPASARRPQAYARANAALAGPRDEELAAGLSARPLPGLPLRVAAEVRLGRTAEGTDVRPAAYAVTELPPFRLPAGARGEAYLQAGYVGGRFATAFVDGQGRAERPVARFGPGKQGAELTAGAGVWGGAQKGAARLDVGPTAALTFRLGEVRGRVAADYRLRIAGDAQPASGPALTISAGF